MSGQVVTLQLPEQLYRRLVEAAEASQQTVNEVALQSLQVGLPPGLEHVPERFRTDLRTLDQLSNEVLWQIARYDLDDEKAKLYEKLLARNQQRQLSKSERQQLGTLREEADLLMLRRSYAFALLKWRGVSIPSRADPTEL